MQTSVPPPRVAIACGGTGGHFFPGVAVAGRLAARGCRITLVISPKDVDQQAASAIRGMDILTLPAIGLAGGNLLGFLRGFWKSYQGALRSFAVQPPRAVLAMGGFTSAPPVLAGRRRGAATFLHESNSVPGRANRWLAHGVQEAFVGFPCATRRLMHQRVTVTGTPVRPEIEAHDPRAARMALGLAPDRPVLLVTGGSQGAAGVNRLVTGALPILRAAAPELQLIHLTGTSEFEKVRAAYAAAKVRAVVRPFLSEMELALGAASVVVSRAGASSLAELSAMQLPAVLIPYPTAADDHQTVNAREFERTGAARVLVQLTATCEELVTTVLELLRNVSVRTTMQQALAQWHRAEAADDIAERILVGARIEARPLAGEAARPTTGDVARNLAAA